jgi:hypothetical protein
LNTAEFLRLLYPFAILSLSGALGRWLLPHSWPYSQLLDGFFEAATIAGLIGLLIEVFAAKRLVEHVSKELAGRLVGRHLPRPLQERISELAVETPFVVHGYTKSYRLKDRPDRYLDVEMTIEYSVLNYSERPQLYVPSWAEEAIYDPQLLRLEYSGGDTSIALEGTALSNLIKKETGSRAQSASGPTQVSIRPAREAADLPDSCRVLWRFKDRMPREYSEVTAFGRPAVGVTLRLDEIPSDLEFFAGDEGFLQAGSTWRSEKAYLTGGHVRAWWFRR